MSARARLKELEKKNINSNKTLRCVGVEGDPESENRCGEYLRSNIQRPFIWLDV
jgi:hypothetical protein